MAVRSYSPDEVLIVWNGIPVSGFADGTFLNIEQDEDAFSLTVGADGEAARAKSNNRSATITLTLLHTSPTNDLLSAAYNVDINSANGVAGPLLVKDNTGNTLVTALTAWIQTAPAIEYAKEPTNREWTLRTDRIEYTNIGGNSRL